jgi:peptidoglycan/LPS O-acetylase OafA/YrhL
MYYKLQSDGWTLSTSKLASYLYTFLLFLLPSFIQNRITRTRTSRRIGPTAFLDGLRGIAAVIVFIHHNVDYSGNFLNHAYGTHAFRSFMQLPFLRLWTSGQPMVHIFFIISGYVLSVKQVRYVRQGNWEKLSDSLFSSAFRRGFRLYLPSIAGLLFFEMTISMGLQGTGHGFFSRVKVLLYSWNWDIPHRGLLHLWTIPVEFSGSMFVFICIITVSRLKQTVRIGAIIAIIVHCLASGHWGPGEFLAGNLLAEIEEILAARNENTVENEKPKLTKDLRDTLNDIFWVSVLVVALYIAGWSKYKHEEEPILRYLIPLIPKVYYEIGGYDTVLAFPFAFVAFFVVWSLFRLPALQAPFTTEVAQYFGDISYSFYIIHDFLLIGYPRYWAALFANRITSGRGSSTRALISILFELSILMSVTMWIADVFWRLIDRPSVRLSKWLETKFRREDSVSSNGDLLY